MNFIYLLFFPGVVLHEFSHYVACLLTGVKVFEVKFFGMGTAYVKHAKPGLTQSLIITLAPFFLCNFLGILLLSEANHLLSSQFLLSIILYWAGASAVYFSFPSDKDALNSFESFVSSFKRKIFTGSLVERLCWLFIMPLVFIPIAIVLFIILFFNYLFFLRLLWLFFAFSIAL